VLEIKKIMKTKLFSILAASALAFASCSSDDPTPSPIKGEQDLSGEISTNTKLDPNFEYNLVGKLTVKAGATLEIPAGTKIKAKNGGTGIFIMVLPGAKLLAQGTAAKPIIFTSASATPKFGDWGGVVLNGKAPLSGPAGTVTTNNAEMDTNIKYGGSDANDNSGIIEYVKIEYTGARIDETKEHNGLTLNGVGKGTKLNQIHIRHAGDDGIEFFGGTVDASNIFVENCSDDMFDFTEGYAGTITNVYGIREQGYNDITNDPRGIEADGNHDGKGPTYVNQSNFKVNGITIINNAADLSSGQYTKMMSEVFKIRRLATAKITNAYVKFGPGTTAHTLIDLGSFKSGTTEINVSESANTNTSIAYTIDPANGLDKAKIVNPLNIVLTPGSGNKGADVSAFSWTGYKFN